MRRSPAAIVGAVCALWLTTAGFAPSVATTAVRLAGARVAAVTPAAATPANNWALTPSASPAGFTDNQIAAVSCPVGGPCVAVGHSGRGGSETALAEEQQGNTWVLVGTPELGSRQSHLDGLSCPSAGECVAVGFYENGKGTDRALVEVFSSGTWTVEPSPDPGAGPAQLAGVSCASASSCVAVGHYTSGATVRALVEVLSGSSWSVVNSPDRSSTHDQLNAVACTSATSCVAVGYYYDGSDDQTLVEALSAGTWELETSPDHGPAHNELDAVSCTPAAGAPSTSAAPSTSPTPSSSGVASPAAAQCAAVGFYYNAHADQTLIEMLAGGAWALAASPDRSVANNLLDGVSCVSVTSCDAVGHYSTGRAERVLVETLSGAAWSAPKSSADAGPGDDQLAGVSCGPTGVCAAVGSYTSGSTYQALVETSNGGPWTVAPSGDETLPHAALAGVACPPAGACTAVGDYLDSTGADRALLETLSGGTWNASPGLSSGPSATGNYLNAVSCPAAGSCAAVGYYVDSAGAYQALLETLSNGAWSVSPAPSPAPGAIGAYLAGVSCPAAGTCAAVGYYLDSTHAYHPLVETLSGGTWEVSGSASPSPGAAALAGTSDAYLTDVSCPVVGSCVAVGYYAGGTGSAQALVETLSGGTWSVGPSPAAPAGAARSYLRGVACPAAGSCVAVGYYAKNSGGAEALAEVLSNGTWSLSPGQSPGPMANFLEGVSCPSEGACVAAGYVVASDGFDEPLVELFANGAWAVAASTASAGPGDNLLAAVACTAAGSCAAVGQYDDGASVATLAGTGTAPPPAPVRTTTSLSSSLNPAEVGQTVTYTASVRPVPTGGKVDFTDNGAVISGCQAAAVNRATGEATCSSAYRAAGNYYLQASFSGFAGWAPSSSLLLDQVVDPLPSGYWLATASGQVFGTGAAPSLGGITTTTANRVVGIAPAPGGHGYWLVTANGTVAAFGDASYHGDLPALKAHVSDIVAMAATPSGRGYWLVGRDGGFFAFGDAHFYGSLPNEGKHVSDIVGMAAAPVGDGYVLIGSDGGVFTFGDARYHGSLPALGQAVTDIRAVLASRGGGYVLVGADGGVFVFGGGSAYYGSLPKEHVRVSDIVGIALSADGKGYYMAGSNGAVYAFGDAKVEPPPVGLAAHLPVVAIAGL
jgi:hypothetical protein